MERTQSVTGECFNPSVRTFSLGRGPTNIYTGRRDGWKKPLEACGCGHTMKIVARYGVFRDSRGGEMVRLGSIYIERKFVGPTPFYRAVVAPDSETSDKFREMGLRFAGKFTRSQPAAEHEQVPEALRIVNDFLTRSGLRWELDGLGPGGTWPGVEDA